jgi:molybdopterin-containing oxidoreductase family iron-sulfur binding subunit
MGLLVSSFDGRPIKIEGNPLHPASLGGTDALAQGTLLQLYDPDRSTEILERQAGSEPVSRTLDAFAAWAAPVFAALKSSGGSGLRILAEPSSSPTLAAAKARLVAAYPRAVWVEWDPLSRDGAREGARVAFGRPFRTHLDLAKARVVAAFDADVLADDPGGVAPARAWALAWARATAAWPGPPPARAGPG